MPTIKARSMRGRSSLTGERLSLVANGFDAVVGYTERTIAENEKKIRINKAYRIVV